MKKNYFKINVKVKISMVNHIKNKYILSSMGFSNWNLLKALHFKEQNENEK